MKSLQRLRSLKNQKVSHIVSEKWVKRCTVSYEYPGPSPSLKGAGDNDLPLNVISTYALLETGWKTVLGNAEESGLFLKKLKLPLNF